MTSEHRPDRFYSDTDHALRGVFGPGDGFINFGYWPAGASHRTLTLADRRQASRRLYAETIKGLHAPPGPWVGVEMGCGQGAGLAHLVESRARLKMVGVELSDQQVRRARARTAHLRDRIEVVHAPAQATGLGDGMADIVLSVEAFQHFPDQEAWLREAHRLLKPRGRLCLTTFFVVSDAHALKAVELLETLASGLDQTLILPGFLQQMSAVGFDLTQSRSIGAHVFEAFSAWGDLHGETWPNDYLNAYLCGAIDYQVLQAVRRDDRC